MHKRLLPLALATFAVGTDGFVIAGLLPAIADDFNVSVAVAGQLITAFALTMAVSAPVLGWATSAMDRRIALLLALGVFVAGNAATALATDYGTALTARILAAAGAGIINSTSSSAAAAIVPPEKRGRALAIVLGGLMLSSAVGLPLGTLIGSGDWRLTLWA
ncbi:MAG: MFS transporter, partial [Stackebrandtia sp.]